MNLSLFAHEINCLLFGYKILPELTWEMMQKSGIIRIGTIFNLFYSKFKSSSNGSDFKKGTAAAHYVLGGPQGNDTNAFSLGTAATEINVMNGETAATAMYSRRLVKDKKPEKI